MPIEEPLYKYNTRTRTRCMTHNNDEYEERPAFEAQGYKMQDCQSQRKTHEANRKKIKKRIDS